MRKAPIKNPEDPIQLAKSQPVKIHKTKTARGIASYLQFKDWLSRNKI